MANINTFTLVGPLRCDSLTMEISAGLPPITLRVMKTRLSGGVHEGHRGPRHSSAVMCVYVGACTQTLAARCHPVMNP